MERIENDKLGELSKEQNWIEDGKILHKV